MRKMNKMGADKICNIMDNAPKWGIVFDTFSGWGTISYGLK